MNSNDSQTVKVSNPLNLMLHFEAKFRKIMDETANLPPGEVVEALAKAATDFVEGYDEFLSRNNANQKAGE